MNYGKEKLEEIIVKSCSNLQIEQPILFDRKNDVNERTISSELSRLIGQYIKGYHINCEYNRMVDETGTLIPKRINLNPNHPKPSSVFPDIIIHRQEDGLNNLLIIEIKMGWKNQRKERDYDKLNRYTMELGYHHGLYIELDENGIKEMTWFP